MQFRHTLVPCLLALALAGCSSTDGPVDVVSYGHDYEEELVLPVEAADVHLLVGTSGYLPSDVDTTTVFLDTAVSEPGILRLTIRVEFKVSHFDKLSIFSQFYVIVVFTRISGLICMNDIGSADQSTNVVITVFVC